MTRCSLVLLLWCWLVTATPGRVIDGDTFDAMIAIWHGLGAHERIRVLGVNTPELKGPTKAAAMQSRAFTEAWLRKGDIQIKSCERDAFGRVLGVVTRSGENLADLLIQAGLGSPR